VEEFSGAQLYQVGVFAHVLAGKTPVVLTMGHSKIIRAYVLPMQEPWTRAVQNYYADREGSRHDLRELRGEAAIASVVMNQYDAQRNPDQFGIIMLGDVAAAYLVPANAYWTRIVEGGQ